MTKKTSALPPGYRWRVASRVLAAALGGYALTSLATAVTVLALPRLGFSTPAQAVLTATLWSFAFYAAVVVWVFSTRSAARAWSGLALGAAIAGLAWGALQ